MDNILAFFFEGHNGTVTYIAFSPDGKKLASKSFKKEIYLWDVETGAIIETTFDGQSENVNWIDISPDMQKLAFGSSDNTVHIQWLTKLSQSLVLLDYSLNNFECKTYIKKVLVHQRKNLIRAM